MIRQAVQDRALREYNVIVDPLALLQRRMPHRSRLKRSILAPSLVDMMCRVRVRLSQQAYGVVVSELVQLQCQLFFAA